MDIYQRPEEKQYVLIKERVRKLKKYYIQLFVFGIGVIVYLSKRYLGAPLNFFPLNFLNEFIMWCWAFLIAVETLKIVFAEKLFTSNWEQRKVNELLDKEEQLKKDDYGKFR